MTNRRAKPTSLIERLAWVVFVAVLVIGVTLLSSRGTRRAGNPKRIEADGVTYVACQGALWLPNNQQPERDNQPQSYEVVFRDAQGVNHELHLVRMLRISDLPSDTPECQGFH
jgi:hypothetical protein